MKPYSKLIVSLIAACACVATAAVSPAVARQSVCTFDDPPVPLLTKQENFETDIYPSRFVPASHMIFPMTAINLPAGTWKLVDYEFVSNYANVKHPMGEEPVGYLLVSQQKYVAITILPSTNADVKPISFVAKLDSTGDMSIHPFASLDPGTVGTDQVSSWGFAGDKLVMITPHNTVDNSYGKWIWQLINK